MDASEVKKRNESALTVAGGKIKELKQHLRNLMLMTVKK